MTVEIRDATSADLDVLYDVCLRTGRSGEDASDLYEDPTLLGSIYVGPYVVLDEGVGFVPVDDEGVGGYVLGTLDTRSFEAACEDRWWPSLRSAHADPGDTPATPDDELRRSIHHPPIAPDEIVAGHPAHLHIDLYPRMQGRGVGRLLMERLFAWLSAGGAPGVHLGVATSNERAIGFYRRLGFTTLRAGDDALFMGRQLP
jgi:ribosomal protein S18 acetylase RimI-like enzyme